MGCGTLKITIEMTGLSTNLNRVDGIDENYWGLSSRNPRTLNIPKPGRKPPYNVVASKGASWSLKGCSWGERMMMMMMMMMIMMMTTTMILMIIMMMMIMMIMMIYLFLKLFEIVSGIESTKACLSELWALSYFSLQSHCTRNLSIYEWRSCLPIVVRNEGLSPGRKNKRQLTLLFCLGTMKLSR